MNYWKLINKILMNDKVGDVKNLKIT